MNDLIFVESQSARQEKLEKTTHEAALGSLNKAKALVMAMWQGTGIATTEQMADYYEISADTVRSVVKNNRGELESDGLKVLKGKDLKDVRSNLDLTPDTAQAIIWTPRAALRLGMLLRDSEVAKQVRTTLLDVVESVPAQHDRIRELELEVEFQKLKNEHSSLQNSMMLMHGKSAVLALAGKSDQLVKVETEITEVVNPDTGSRVKILTADQLKTVIKERTGQKLVSLKWFAEQLRALGRDDLLVPVSRSHITEYPIPDKVDEAISLIYQSNRQKLIGE
jgi:hypothetical protein